jgi:hypothetical protein
MHKKNDKLESKLSVVNGGYSKRAEVSLEDILQDFADKTLGSKSRFIKQQSTKFKGGINRIEGLKQDVRVFVEELCFKKNVTV